MDLSKDLRKKAVVYETLERAKAHGKGREQLWFLGYFLALDAGASHGKAMDLADLYMEHRDGGERQTNKGPA